MEILEVNIHTNGDENCLRNVVNYPISGEEVLAKGFGVTPYDSDAAFRQFRQTAEFFNNQGKTPVYHYMTSFTKETAPTAERAMELTQEIFEPIIKEHLTLIGAHNKARGNSCYHTHIVVSPTNYNDGSMLYANNAVLYNLACRVADATGQPCRLVVKPENKAQKEFHKMFYPQNYPQG